MEVFHVVEILKKHKSATFINVQNGVTGVVGVLVQFLVELELVHLRGNVSHKVMHVRGQAQEQRNAIHIIAQLIVNGTFGLLGVHVPHPVEKLLIQGKDKESKRHFMVDLNVQDQRLKQRIVLGFLNVQLMEVGQAGNLGP